MKKPFYEYTKTDMRNTRKELDIFFCFDKERYWRKGYLKSTESRVSE